MPPSPSRASRLGAVWFLFAAALMSVSCRSTVNQDACRAYVEHLNGLACRAADVDPAATCPENYDSDGATSCAEFFDCLTEQARCDGDVFINDVGACTSCVVRE